jgi:3-oxoacid CoA-transferase
VVSLIITELAVFQVQKNKGMMLIEVAEGVSVEEIRKKTGAPFEVSINLITMLQ